MLRSRPSPALRQQPLPAALPRWIHDSESVVRLDERRPGRGITERVLIPADPRKEQRTPVLRGIGADRPQRMRIAGPQRARRQEVIHDEPLPHQRRQHARTAFGQHEPHAARTERLNRRARGRPPVRTRVHADDLDAERLHAPDLLGGWPVAGDDQPVEPRVGEETPRQHFVAPREVGGEQRGEQPRTAPGGGAERRIPLGHHRGDVLGQHRPDARQQHVGRRPQASQDEPVHRRPDRRGLAVDRRLAVLRQHHVGDHGREAVRARRHVEARVEFVERHVARIGLRGVPHQPNGGREGEAALPAGAAHDALTRPPSGQSRNFPSSAPARFRGLRIADRALTAALDCYYDAVMSAMDDTAWQHLWKALDVLAARALDLRRLSQEEPLKKARPDYPHGGIGRSHEDELRAVFADLARTLAEVTRLLPSVLPDGTAPPDVDDETPSALAARLSTLEKLTANLAREAFEPLPPLPPHAPPYLVTLPGHDLPGTTALLLGSNIIETVGALRNALLAAANAAPRRP